MKTKLLRKLRREFAAEYKIVRISGTDYRLLFRERFCPDISSDRTEVRWYTLNKYSCKEEAIKGYRLKEYNYITDAITLMRIEKTRTI